MRRRLPLILLAALLLAGGLLWRGRRASDAPGSALTPAESAAAGAAPGPALTPAEARRREARARRDELHARIVQALAAVPAATPAGVGAPATPGVAPAAAVAQDLAPRPPGNLTDRMGGREALARALNHDFMPLADECIERAQERAPGLAGMLILGIETAADKDLGAVVEKAEPSPRNGVTDAALLECLRETALTLRLPPPPGSGREQFEISLRVEPSPGAPRDR